MKRLYAPWRSSYTRTIEHQKIKTAGTCILCSIGAEPQQDEKNFVLKRFECTYLMLNLYPYNGGHLLIIPYQHAPRLDQLSAQTRTEIMEVANDALKLLTQELAPDGFNLGINMASKAAGGSIPEHIHMHVLPRWNGDTSFLPTLAATKPISEDLQALYKQLKQALETTIT